MENKSKIARSYLRNISKYLDGYNFYEVFIKNNRIELSEFLAQLNKQVPVYNLSSNMEILEELYNFLLNNYRNDIIYKIEFIDSIEQFISDITNSFIVNEFKFGRNLLDLAVFNGKSVAFEVKSDVDNANNIEKQFKFYSETFDYCYLITNEKKVDSLIDKIPTNSGVIFASDEFEFTLYRQASKNKKISFSRLFRILRKKEYLDIVRQFYQEIPAVPNTRIFQECYNLLSQVEFEKFKKEFLNKIKEREYSIRVTDIIQREKIVRQGYLANSKIL